MKHPKDGRVVAAEVPDRVARLPVKIPSDQRRRDALADWLTSKDNPFFAKSIVNRVWSYFFGRGIIDPVDDIRASNPPINPALLDALTKDFIDHDFDLRHLMRTIANSRAYQASIATNEWNEKDADNFSHAMPRRLTAEQLMDARRQRDRRAARASGSAAGYEAAQVPDPHIGKDGFLDLFGRPSRESACECERRTDLSLPQALNLVNGKTISDAVADPKGRVAKSCSRGQDRRRDRRRVVSGVAERASRRRPKSRTAVEVSCAAGSTGRRGRRICCGRCSTARHFCTAINKELTRHAQYSWTSRHDLRRSHPARTAAHRVARACRACICPASSCRRRRRWRTARRKYDGARGFGSAKNRDHDLPAGRAEPHRHLGPEARRAGQHSRRVQADQDEDSGHAHRRAHADDGQTHSTRSRSSGR